MKNYMMYYFIITVLLVNGFAGAVACANAGIDESPEGRIIVDMAARGADVSPAMYGIFFEEINHSGDGGLYAELVRNRSFEDKEFPQGFSPKGNVLYPPQVRNHVTGGVCGETFRWSPEECPGWSLECKGNVKASMRLTRENPRVQSAPNSLEIKIPDGAEDVSLVNGGFWGMGVREGENYNLRCFMRTSGYTGKIKARLISQDGKILAENNVSIAKKHDWNEYLIKMSPAKTDAKAVLAFCLEGKGTVRFDYVSLFPENTFRKRPNGLRQDEAEFLSGMHPGFVRWPGGCIVEGISLNNRFEWKKTLGDPAARPGEYDLWGYRHSYGFGYHEFLQFCEDIGTKGMFVCNVGIACQGRTGEACGEGDVKYYLNDALDAIEYAIGGVSTEWGAKRAKAGHPGPFPLKYVEIGNENWGEVYNRRFDIFYKAIKEKYPELTLISNHSSGSDVKGIKKTDMIDPHWYVAPEFFFRNANIFDSQPRGQYQVYVGEYAVNREVGSGNLLAALSEAAFITGMERNSDLVQMASYAPLLENSNDRAWPVNLIWINNMQVVGRSSYYVQKMFSENIPSYNLNTGITPRPKDNIAFNADGYAGVGTWSTQTEFRDFKISRDGVAVMPGEGDWLRKSGDWRFSGGVISQTSEGNMTALMFDKNVNGKYTIEFKVRKTGGSEGFMIYCGMDESGRNGYLFNIGGWGNTQTVLEKMKDGAFSNISEQVSQTIETNRWYDVRVEKSAHDFSLWMDGKLILRNSPLPDYQFAAGGYDEKTGDIIIKVVNAEEKPWRANVSIKNCGRISKEGGVTVLSSASLNDENSFEEPLKISPQKETFSGFSPSFNYEFRPCSFTVFRIKVTK